jgi:hypothetical protein
MANEHRSRLATRLPLVGSGSGERGTSKGQRGECSWHSSLSVCVRQCLVILVPAPMHYSSSQRVAFQPSLLSRAVAPGSEYRRS